jgi:ribonuclease-3
VSIASEELEKKIGYVFQDPRLLHTALTHASLQEHDANYERLEFVGDRVLGLVVATLLYRAFPSEREGALAKRHTALVQKKALAHLAEKMDLAPYLRMSPGERKAGGMKKDTILGDALEALIGAIYLDGGYARAEEFITGLWQDVLQEKTPPEDPKTRLQEWAQGQGLPLPLYRVLSRTGSDHAPVFEVEVLIEGYDGAAAKASSKRQAEKDAALLMLERIGDGK